MSEREIFQLRSGGYAVESLSHPGYFARVRDKDCSCPAGRAGAERCAHRTALAVYIGRQDRAQKRPTAPPHIDALVGEPPWRPRDPYEDFVPEPGESA